MLKTCEPMETALKHFDGIEIIARNGGKVHLVGVCGVGMAGLACLLKQRGCDVSGCDAAAGRLAEWLESIGIRVERGHSVSHIASDLRCVVTTPAVPSDCPELLAAKAAGVAVLMRGTVLPELLAGRLSVAVAGTHGKTTTAWFVAQILAECGRAPSWCIGGELPRGEGLGPGGAGSGDCIVVEADESDGTLALYSPDIALLTSLDYDHMEHFAGIAAFEECFMRFCRNAGRDVIYCADHERLAALCESVSVRKISYGLGEGADIRGRDISFGNDGTRFVIERNGIELGAVRIAAPGMHNVLNALGAAAAGFAMGLDFDGIRLGLAAAVLPRRRFEKVVETDGVLVVSDYAHHPAEIAALTGALRNAISRSSDRLSRLTAVFQPHRYTRTAALREDFPAAFAGVDRLLLVPVYPAFERPAPGGTVWDLYAAFRAKGESDVAVAGTLEEAWGYLRREIKDGDVLAVVGAGDVEKIADWAGGRWRDGIERKTTEGALGGDAGRETFPDLGSELRGSIVRFDEPMAGKTTLRVGGKADIWVEAGTVDDLRALLRFSRERDIPFRIIGAGSNTLIPDTGLRGITARLSGPVFRHCGVEKEPGEDGAGRRVRVGAGCALACVVELAAEHGFAGLEFLAGIPGSAGGALRMNAGAQGDDLARRVLWIRCLNMDGSECTIVRSELGASYRSCRAAEGRIVLEICLEARVGRQDNVRRRVNDILAGRQWLRGKRCAGSVFRNPSGAVAGRLLDDAELKGFRVGGAAVSMEHANVVETYDGATATDVRAVMEIGRDIVRRRTGIRLEPEIVVMES